MTLQPSLIAPFQSGLVTDTDPWQAPADSFSTANNVHVKNGNVEKRQGYKLFGTIQKLDASIAITGITNAPNGLVTTGVNHGYTTGDIVYISGVLGMTQVNGYYFIITVTALNQFELTTDTTAYGIYTGAGTVAKSIPDTDRIMGIAQFLKTDGSHETIAFSTKRAYKYDLVSEKFLVLDAADIMNGGETDFVWSLNLQSSSLTNRLYFTNGKEFAGGLNGIRYYDGSGTGYTTTQFTPSLGGGRNLYGAKLLFSLNERLIAMHTHEFDGAAITTYPQRMRWCQAQGPSNWNDLTPGGGGYIDCPTGDQIITGRPLQNEIIVVCSKSVFAAQPISDPALPFTWTKLNDFRAADGKMASAGYDRYVLSAGVRGLVATDGADTQRVDLRISDFIIENINVEKFEKVFMARSFSERRTWILYPEGDENDNALIYDEESQAFTTYSIDLNCLGYGNLSQDLTLDYFTAEHDLDIDLTDVGDETLLSYVYGGRNEIFLGGDINGSIFVLETATDDDGNTIDVELITAGWNPFLSEGLQSYFSYIDIYADSAKQTKALIEFYKDDETAPYSLQYIDFLPNLDYVSTIEDITNANPGVVTASDHGLLTGDKVFIYGADGMEEINDIELEITVLDQNTFSIAIDTSAFGAFTGDGSVYRKQFYKTKVWKRAYAGGVGYLHKIRIVSTGVERPLTISGFKPVFKPRGRRVVN